MDHIPIAKIEPQLSDLYSKSFKAVVTLLWPYSSSTRQCALLLAEPDFRLRRKKGQVRVRFSSSSAKAIAQTGIGIGDEVILELRGAQFVQEDTDAVRTPGRSIDWELSYSQTLVVQISRNGTQIATLDIIDAAPTPAVTSPIRKPITSTPYKSPAPQSIDDHKWTSPAFLKRSRLSNGAHFESEYDPLVDDAENGGDKKRRRKSYRDWNVWTYSARTPSPEKEECEAENVDGIETSPVPVSSLSSTKQPVLATSAPPIDMNGTVRTPESLKTENTSKPEDSRKHNLPTDNNNYDLYADPDEANPSDVEYAYGGDTAENTEANTDEELDDASNTRDQNIDNGHPEVPNYEVSVVVAVADGNEKRDDGNSHEQPSIHEELVVIEDESEDQGHISQDRPAYEGAEDAPPSASSLTPYVVMPPPTLPTLQTDFSPIPTPGLLTPIGKEPSSPVIRPLDSATLPMPSPFPGEQDATTSSYLDYTADVLEDVTGVQLVEEEPLNKAVHDAESSFYSSTRSVNVPTPHRTHESAFTDIRFTFGLDGTMLSRQKEGKEEQDPIGADFDHAQDIHDDGKPELVSDTGLDIPNTSTVDVPSQVDPPSSSQIQENESIVIPETMPTESQLEASPALEDETPHASVQQSDPEVEVIALTSDSESDRESIADDAESLAAGDEEHQISAVDWAQVQDNQQSMSMSDLIDLDSDSEQEIEEEKGVVGEMDVHTEDSQERDESASDVSRDESGMASPVNLDSQDSGAQVQSFEEDREIDDSTESAKPPHGVENASLSDHDGYEHHAHLNAQADPSASLDTAPSFENAQVPEDDRLSEISAVDIDEIIQNRAYAQPESRDARPTSPEHHPDIKIESIEDDSSFELHEQKDSQPQKHEDGSNTSPKDDLVIEVPGHKMGEMVEKTVSAAGPARSTRSKTKSSISPPRESLTPSQPKKVHKRSKGSLGSITDVVLSPTNMRLRSTITPDTAPPESPYYLRSQSKRLTSTPVAIESTTRRTPGTASKSLASPLQDSFGAAQRPLANTSMTPEVPFSSQDWRSSQRSFADVTVVGDSDVESVHSEGSLSTNTPSNKRESLASNNEAAAVEASGELLNFGSSQSMGQGVTPKKGKKKPNYLDLSEVGTPTRNAILGASEDAVSEVSLESPMKTPIRRSPRLQRSRRDIYDIPDTPRQDHEATGSANGKLPQISHDSFPGPHLQQTENHLEQAKHLTPKLTRITSTNLHTQDPSEDIEMEEPTSPTKSTPRRNNNNNNITTTLTSPASPTRTPSVRSEDLSDLEDTTTTTTFAAAAALTTPTSPPSIGLSTPISYYTPLKDLPYFLNRSSQTTTNPDILALVTTPTTPPKRAEKGPKHFSTTLHITDLSIFSSHPPSASQQSQSQLPTAAERTVQVFRPNAAALPVAGKGDVVLLRGFAVRSAHRRPYLLSTEESAWCVWRFDGPPPALASNLIPSSTPKGKEKETSKTVWGSSRKAREAAAAAAAAAAARGDEGAEALKAREEVRGPEVERGIGERKEVERLRGWWGDVVEGCLAEGVGKGEGRWLRSMGRDGEKGGEGEEE
ncbi:hypothetical protein BU24DRAFT_487819 [Aaosphaeria arxii CBS 175.79]|uniref:Telomeric single stranded DNA binding POT1/Cdc13 domain-containing protein n=1 Tax=Aaosphaeria arxii CBS 175.79 TaxID=1450172 RepID=A0A6A5Y7W4_9PLEO|nr:uncharacterized protein BU24DRAFT_487819 [Aaosphaeria arxii CBS 175.79]KAF2021386.1 hypothetical protein BU24DRAFT_487819 [Aaosphaeria arxii CBS 175.79]